MRHAAQGNACHDLPARHAARVRNGQAPADAAIVAAGRTGGFRSDASGFSMRRPLSGPLSGELVAFNELGAGQAPGSRMPKRGLGRGESRLIPARPGAVASAPAWPCRYHAATMPQMIALGSVCDVRASRS